MEKNRKGKTKVIFHSRIMNRKNFEDDRPAREYGESWKEGRKEGREGHRQKHEQEDGQTEHQ